MLHKIVNNVVEVDLSKELIPLTRHFRNCHAKSLRMPYEKKTFGKTYLQYSFLPRTINKENTSATSSELWGLGFAEGSLGFDSSTTDSTSDISAVKPTVNSPEREMRERERTHSTRTNLRCRGTNQKVAERPVKNCSIPAENTFIITWGTGICSLGSFSLGTKLNIKLFPSFEWVKQLLSCIRNLSVSEVILYSLFFCQRLSTDMSLRNNFPHSLSFN